ncbi:hypothetical protein TNCV_4668221 [Trichonephila clavipes]|nr:hypothetical protein TNCV_4668221 [Trichonephila clavipes]
MVCSTTIDAQTHYSKSFAAEWNVHKTSIAVITIVSKPLIFASAMAEMANEICLKTSHASACNTSMVRLESGDIVERGCLMDCHSGLGPGIMVWGGIRLHSRIPITQ